jgi:hypothetical protein
LPRTGVGRTLDPILYTTADLSLRQRLGPRWGLRAGEHFEAAKIYYQPWEVTPSYGNPTGAFMGTAGTCGPGTVAPGTGAPVDCVPSYQTAPGFVNAPFAELYYELTRRVDLAAGERVQFFNFGGDFAIGNGPYGTVRYRITHEAHFSLTAGPVVYSDHPSTVYLPGGKVVQGQGASGILPRVSADLGRDGPQLEYGIHAGHDLVGASGFTDVLWADYASLYARFKLTPLPLSLFGGPAYYRNGLPPNNGELPLFSSHGQVSQGYALEAGAEWKLSRMLLVQGVYDRLAQIGAVFAGQPDLTRNIVALRLVWVALQ